MEDNFDVRKLKNGTPVLLATFPDSESVTIGISYNVGGRNEYKRDASYDGISHFLEHQFFKGNPETGLTPFGVNAAFDALGGISNAFTTEDTTCYFVKCLNTEVYKAIDLWNKLLIFGKINQEDFDKEAFVVKQEFRRMEDSPPFLLYTKMKKALNKGTSLEMDVIGNEASLTSVTLEQMESYRFEHYGLENACLMILGNYDKEAVFNKLEKTFGVKETKSEKPRYELTSYTPPTESKLEILKVDKDTPLVFFGLGLKTPGAKSSDELALEILMSYITLGKSSLLQEKLVRSGVCAFATSFTQVYEDLGNLVLLAGAPPQIYPQAHEETMKMLYHVLNMELTEEWLENILNRIDYDYRSSSEEPMDMLSSQSTDYWRKGKFESMEERLAHLRSVTLDDIDRVRKQVFGNLEGIYGLMGGDTNAFTPQFPENTWNGTFQMKQ